MGDVVRVGRVGRSPARPRIAGALRAAAVAAVAATALGCSSGGYGGTGPDGFDPPGDHTVRRDGVFHAPGLSDPFASCVECHGADLQGGAAGEPSCFRCHDDVWSARGVAAPR